jgi:hypothetical protein
MIAIVVAIGDMMDALYAEDRPPDVQADVNPDTDGSNPTS